MKDGQKVVIYLMLMAIIFIIIDVIAIIPKGYGLFYSFFAIPLLFLSLALYYSIETKSKESISQ